MASREIVKFSVGVIVAAGFVALPLQGQERYSFGGIVVSEKGEFMENVLVRAVPESANGVGDAAATRSDSTGNYRFENIPLGSYRIQAGDPSENLVTVRVLKFAVSADFAAFFSATAIGGSEMLRKSVTSPYVLDAARISLGGNSPERLNIAVLKSAFSVSGRVATPAGISLPPRRLSVSSMTSAVLADVKIQNDGTFEIPLLPSGTFDLRVIPNLGLPNSKITISKEDLKNVEIGPVTDGVRIAGNVPVSEVPGTEGKRPDWIVLEPQGAEVLKSGSIDVAMFGLGLLSTSGEPRNSIIDENGELRDLPLAPVGTDGSFLFLTVRPGSYLIRSVPVLGIPSTPLEITAGVNLNNVQVGITTRIRGEIVPLNLGNRPPDTITLTPVQGGAGLAVSAIIDDRGLFEFPKVGPGTYRILLDGKPKATPPQFEVGLDERFVRLEAPFESWVNGRIVFNGTRMSAEDLESVKVGMTNGYGSNVESDGTFRVKSNDGEYAFYITGLPEAYEIRSITYGSDNVMNSSFQVDASRSPREITVMMDYKSGTTLPAR